jgi:hypothetical protein
MISFELQTDQKEPSTVARPLDPNDVAYCGYAIIVVAIPFSQFIFSGGRIVPDNF